MRQLYALPFFIMLLLLSNTAQSQSSELKAKLKHYASLQPKGKTHHGFYMRGALGATLGRVDFEDRIKGTSQSATGNFKGAGVVFDLQIGAALANNTVITGDIINNIIINPKLTANGQVVKLSDSTVTLEPVTFGLGITNYLMPQNIYFSGTIGTGTVLLQYGNQGSRTTFGFSVVLRLGKSWWISKSLGMGINVAYYYLNAKTEDSVFIEELTCQRFLITATFSLH